MRTEFEIINTFIKARKLSDQYGLEECLKLSKQLLDADDEEFYKLTVETDNKCIKQICRFSTTHGMRMLYIAFLYLEGNLEAVELHMRFFDYQINDDVENF